MGFAIALVVLGALCILMSGRLARRAYQRSAPDTNAFGQPIPYGKAGAIYVRVVTILFGLLLLGFGLALLLGPFG